MNAMTEDEAREKWCPFARVLNGHKDGPYNRTNGGNEFYANPAKAHCIGSQCMAWQWSGNGAAGYCGLAAGGGRGGAARYEAGAPNKNADRAKKNLPKAPVTKAGTFTKDYGWLPISEAPRDGTTIDLWIPFSSGRVEKCRRADAYFLVDETGEEMWMQIWLGTEIHINAPTHFRYLPPPPQGARRPE